MTDQGIILEELRPVEGHAGYFVSIDGRVYCTRPIGRSNKERHPHLIKPLPCSSGRYLQFGANKKKILIHRAVAAAFIGPCPDGREVSHKDGNSHNNRLSNLEYVSHIDNERMKWLHGTNPCRERNSAAKLTQKQVLEIVSRVKSGKRGEARQVAREFNVSESLVSMLRSGKRGSVSSHKENPSEEGQRKRR